MNMPPPLALKAYQDPQRALTHAASAVAQESLDDAAATVRQVQQEAERLGHTAVTFDDTWMKRGHTSLHGMTSAIPWLMGQIVDHKVHSQFCHLRLKKCSAVTAGKVTEAQFDEWYEGYRAECCLTTTGSSAYMEVTGAVEL